MAIPDLPHVLAVSSPTDVPPRLAAIIARCLEKDPAERFVDARALERAFTASVSGEEWTETHAREWWQMRQQPALAMS